MTIRVFLIDDHALVRTGLRLILGTDTVETSVRLYGFSMGLVILCLTQFFARGVELEQDVEGLV